MIKYRRIALCSLLFTGCTLSLSKEEQTQNVLSTPTLTTDSTFAQGKWPQRNWWESYHLKELDALIEKALSGNPTIQAVQQRIEQAKAQAVMARSELFPLIYFDASDQWQYLSKNGLYRALNPNISLNNQQIDFSLSFFYEFDFWGKYQNLYQAALSQVQVAIAETDQAELIATTALAQCYFALRTNLLRKTVYDQLYEVRKRYFDLQTKMLHSSLYSKLLPLLSEEKVFQAQQWLDQIEQEIAVNLHMVNLLAGQGPQEPLDLNEPLQPLAAQLAVPNDISLELLARRPDLRAQICRLDSLAFEVGAARADFWPNINISSLAGFQAGSWSKLFEWTSKTIGVLPGLSLPVYTAGAIGAHVSAKKALFDEAIYQYNDLILLSFNQVADLLAIGKAVYGEKEKQLQIVENAQARYGLTLLRQRKGIDSALTTYQRLEEVLQKKLEDIQLLYQQYVVNLSLIRALGGGYEYLEESP